MNAADGSSSNRSHCVFFFVCVFASQRLHSPRQKDLSQRANEQHRKEGKRRGEPCRNRDELNAQALAAQGEALGFSNRLRA